MIFASRYIFGVAPKLGSGGSVLAYLDKSIYDSSVDGMPGSFKFMSMDIHPESVIRAYATTVNPESKMPLLML